MKLTEILAIMERSDGHVVEVEDVKGRSFRALVELYESRYDNEDDAPPYNGEASICLKIDEKYSCMLYESDISFIRIAD